MGNFLTTASVMMCPHGGMVQAMPGSSRVTAVGAPVLRNSDSFTILGCIMNVSGSPHPCVTVQWVTTANRSTIDDPTLTDDCLGLCKAGDQAVQGVVQVASAQPRVSGT
jgi:hypothetical protein